MAKLIHRLRQQIQAHGPMRFDHFMREALYAPDGGYYTQPGRVGKSGDFFTSVSVGECFGELMGTFFVEKWHQLGNPTPCWIIEQGANNARFAADVLTWAQQHARDFFAALRWHIIEPLSALQDLQWAALAQWREIVEISAAPPTDKVGIFFANELLDALPVRRVIFDGEWKELSVAILADNFEFVPVEADPALREAIAIQVTPWLPQPPRGFTTELCLELEPWFQDTLRCLRRGIWVLIDYGWLAAELFSIDRPNGTLRGYRQHRLVTDPLSEIGETDLTCHVNWSEVLRLCEKHGLRASLQTQSRFLTQCAAPLLKEWENAVLGHAERQKWLRQFQTLTHPTQLGAPFQVLLAEK